MNRETDKRDDKLRSSLRAAQRQADGLAPGFDDVFSAAEVQAKGSPRRHHRALAAAAVIAALAIAVLLNEPDEFIYVDMDELTATTTWSAPSDSLLPTHQFDIYRDLPELIDLPVTSTKSIEGALL